jgi:nucleotide-binding universal stress UspA family protein
LRFDNLQLTGKSKFGTSTVRQVLNRNGELRLKYMAQTKESAREDFSRARHRADLEKIVASLTGKSADLLSFEEVRKKVRGVQGNRRVLKDVPLDSIVGSVGRYEDFTRDFLPRRDSDKERWAKVESLANESTGLPPVDLFQIGDAYFVNDGNHRVSVARQSGHTHIEAYVTDVHTRVPLSPGIQAKDLILKSELADFLECTRLDFLRPGADITVTSPGAYADLLKHIEVHHYFMGLDQKREIPFEEAVTHWYDTVFSPVIEVIRKGDILSEFPGRTHADLYLWILRHRAELEEELDWEIRTESAAADFTARRSRAPDRVLTRFGRRFLEKVVPSALDAGPPVGDWRRERLATRDGGSMFIDLLVVVDETVPGFHGLELALRIARTEGAIVHGLHLVSSEDQIDSERVNSLRVTFNRTCHAAGIPGRLAVEVEDLAESVCDRARWSDLVVIDRSPTSETSLHDIIQHCSRPVLLVPGPAQELKRALLVYDGSPKAREALYVATYLASRQNVSLVIFATKEGDQKAMRKTVTVARRHLRKHGVDAELFETHGPIAAAIRNGAMKAQCDLIIIGGYSQHPLLAPKNSLDELLRLSQTPIVICR